MFVVDWFIHYALAFTFTPHSWFVTPVLLPRTRCYAFTLPDVALVTHAFYHTHLLLLVWLRLLIRYVACGAVAGLPHRLRLPVVYWLVAFRFPVYALPIANFTRYVPVTLTFTGCSVCVRLVVLDYTFLLYFAFVRTDSWLRLILDYARCRTFGCPFLAFTFGSGFCVVHYHCIHLFTVGYVTFVYAPRCRLIYAPCITFAFAALPRVYTFCR